MIQNIALKLAYDGTPFFGWQKTSLGSTVEETLQQVLERILQHPIVLQAASRTDRGVHAEGQWVNFHTHLERSLSTLQKSLNALLPPTIRVLALHAVPPEFHPTLLVEKKEYHYQVCWGPLQLPSLRQVSWHVPYTLNLERMESACHHFLGTQDFTSYCNFRKNLNYKDKIRQIFAVNMLQKESHRLLFVIEGNHFLYKMVRNIVGTLVDVGRGKIQPEAIPSILSARQRNLAGVTAPPHGLTLKKIYYPQEFRLEL